MAGVINTGSFAKDLLPFIGKWFGDEYKDYEPLYSRIFKVEDASSRFVEEPLVSGFDLPVQMGDGEAVSYDNSKQGYNKRYTMNKYGLGFIITREMLDDGLALMNGEKFSRMLRGSMEKGREVISHNVLNNAFDSNFTGGDGKELCAADHPTMAADLDNLASTDLSETSVEQAWIDIGNFKDDRGLKIHVMPKKLVIPLDEKFNADRILNSPLRVATADNDKNAVKDVIDEVCVSPYITDTNAWYIITDANDGLKYKNRQDITLSTDNDFDTDNAKFKAIMRFDVGWTDPRGVYGSAGA